MLKEDKIHISSLVPFLPQPWEPSAIADCFSEAWRDTAATLMCLLLVSLLRAMTKGDYSDSQFKDAVLPSVGVLQQELEAAGCLKTEEMTAWIYLPFSSS